jgi:starch synthase
VTTVSPTYAREIKSSKTYGKGLEGILRKRGSAVTGIVNGIDAGVWSPSIDPHLPARYSAEDLSGKAACKAALQGELGLPVKPDAPLLGSVGRLVEQKGTTLLLEAAEALLSAEPDCQIAVLGQGEPAVERALAELERRLPDSVRVRIGFDERLAHLIEAGCDVFLMPSLYEPCGLNQMYSMVYGTIPVVRRTGGLADTVEDSPEGDPSRGTGFVFDEFAAEDLLGAVLRAVRRFRDPGTWSDLVRRAMARDWSWARSAGEYVALYERLVGSRLRMASHLRPTSGRAER